MFGAVLVSRSKPCYTLLGDKMVYICEKCKFLFSRTVEPEQCPDCGKIAVRPATEMEKREFEQLLAEAKRDPL